jgi:hypothetical protein
MWRLYTGVTGVNVEALYRGYQYRVNVEAIYRGYRYRVNVEALYMRYQYRVNVQGHRLVEAICTLT